MTCDKVTLNSIKQPAAFDYDTDFPFNSLISTVELSDKFVTLTYFLPEEFTLLAFVQQVRKEAGERSIKAVDMLNRRAEVVYTVNYSVTGYAGFKTALRADAVSEFGPDIMRVEISFHATPIWPEPRSN